MSKVACTLLAASLTLVRSDETFALDLEACIQNHAFRLAETFPLCKAASNTRPSHHVSPIPSRFDALAGGDKCAPVTSKVDYQAKIYEETLMPIYEKHGYTGALWCAMYSLGMVPIVDTSQPNNPKYAAAVRTSERASGKHEAPR